MDSTVKFLIFSSAIIFVPRLDVLAEDQYPPSIIQQPLDSAHGEIPFHVKTDNSYQEKTIRIPCVAEGDPEPNYYWTKNGKHFNWTSEGNRISQEGGKGTLTISTPEASDEGLYQCFAQNIWGIALSNAIYLRQIQFEPHKEDAPVIKQAFEGQPFNLSCQAPNGYPKPDVNWFKLYASDKLTPANKDPRISVDSSGTLWFSNIIQSDSSASSDGTDFIYKCVATQIYSNETRTVTKILLDVLPTNTSYEQNKTALVKQFLSEKEQVAISNKKINLYCIFGGTPLPTIKWEKDGKPLKFQSGTSLINNGNTIEIQHVTPEDEGNYTCHASNGVDDLISHTINLKVLVEPRLVTKPGEITVAEGANVFFKCTAKGNPEPTITWIYNGKPLSEAPSNPRRKISANSIFFQKVQQNDTGNYGCAAINIVGYDYEDSYLNVLKITFN